MKEITSRPTDSTEQFTFFLRGEFSQWHMQAFTIDGIVYNCCEQFMMAQKARLFGDTATEAEIMAAGTPKEQKALGRKVANFDADMWNAVARDIVYRGNYAKFTQNADLREKLLATIGTTMVEAASYDKIWGVGLDESDERIRSSSNWQGTNWLGEVLDKVRADIAAGVETVDGFGWK